MYIYFGHNHLSALLIFAIPINLYLLKKYWTRKGVNMVLLVTCYLLLVTLFLTFSRASLLSLLLAGIISAFLFKLFPKGKMLLFAGVTLFISLAFAFSINNARQLGVSKYTVSNSARIVYWKTAIVNGLSHQLTGSG